MSLEKAVSSPSGDEITFYIHAEVASLGKLGLSSTGVSGAGEWVVGTGEQKHDHGRE